ncbi:MAG: ribosome maturation factor RimM [Gallionellales bacterium RIFCSPLOWO2_12_FULL_59_22]|nr:MAG: ribosome maturation factor RimM [Gallionellales bacterium RIFCSPLOWO2_02_FULL_59_110]OGT04858.1 MAG: ribosome maturation factor RimM [Gallionellales bacterium RIFCSPLOWO2_02_58_13]OGT12026.1 MAG: ribosome maturation factor RimM [Gallionellales bacterium RIFCSPLOWO2_12_FULL_59_22]
MVVMGRIAAAHGIRGLVKIQPFTEHVDSLLDYPTWWIGHEHGPWREVEVDQREAHGKTLVAQLPDCPDRTAAEKLKGLLIAVPRSSLPQQGEGEYYWSDLIGLAVVNEAGVTLGTVANLLETGANEVLSVKGDSGEMLIPFVAQAIRRVDLKNSTIHVDWSADYLR